MAGLLGLHGGTLLGAAAGAPATDPNFSSVSLLCHFDGADASTTFTDHGPIGHTLTANGDAQIDTDHSKFGGASGLFDGTGDYVSAGDHTSFEFGSGNFTIEMFLRFSNVSGNQFPVAKWVTSGNQREWALQMSNAVTVLFQYSTNGTNFPDVQYNPTTLVINTWYHFAVDFNGTNLRIYENGVMKAKGTLSGALHAGTAPLTIGARSVPDNYFKGWIEELRITKGVARYASDSGFTVPTAAYPNS